MSESAVPANATAWIQSHLTTLYEGGVGVSVQDTFDQTFSPGCEVRLDHAVRTPQALKDDLATRHTAASHSSVAWGADVISTNDSDPKEPAVVAGAFVVTRTLPFRIRAGPAQRLSHVHFSARIEKDASVLEGDQRRITSYYYTQVDRTPPIHFATPHTAQQGGSDGQ